MTERKYIKPKSLTWWAGVALIAMGGAVAISEGYDLGGMKIVLHELTGGVGAAALIAQGAGLVGIRGAL